MSRAMAESDLYLRPSNSNPSRSTIVVCSTPFHSRTSRVPTTGLRELAVMAALPGCALDLVGESIEELGCLARDTAVGQFLNSMRQAQLKEAATVVRASVRTGLPFRLQIVRHALQSATRASTVASRSLCSPGRGGPARWSFVQSASSPSNSAAWFATTTALVGGKSSELSPLCADKGAGLSGPEPH